MGVIRNSELFPLVEADVRLVQNTAQRTDWDLLFSRNDCCIRPGIADSREFHVTAFLAHFPEPRGFKAALDLSKR